MKYDRETTRKGISKFKKVFVFIVLISVFGFIVSLSYINGFVLSANKPKEGEHITLDLVNKTRGDQGVSSLIWNSKLADAALQKANSMVGEKYFDHASKNGKTPWDFMEENGYKYIYAGENLAIDFQDLQDAENALENSKTHMDNIVNPKFKEFGSAVVKGEIFDYESNIYVQMFGTQQLYLERILTDINR